MLIELTTSTTSAPSLVAAVHALQTAVHPSQIYSYSLPGGNRLSMDSTAWGAILEAAKKQLIYQETK